jgi:hypothetical protein
MRGWTRLRTRARAQSQGPWVSRPVLEQGRRRRRSAPIHTLKRRSIVFMGDVTLTLAACGAMPSSSRSSRSRTPVNSAVPPAHSSALCGHTQQLSTGLRPARFVFHTQQSHGASVAQGRAREDDAVVQVAADVQVALADALLHEPWPPAQARQHDSTAQARRQNRIVHTAGMRDSDMRAWQALEVGAIVRLHRRQAGERRQHTLRGHRTARVAVRLTHHAAQRKP